MSAPVQMSAPVIEGYASLWDRPDFSGDVVLKGAFAASLDRRGPRGIRMLWSHDPADPVGIWTDMREDAIGLYVRGELTPGARRSRDLEALVAAGAVDGLSIGFRTLTARRRTGGGRFLVAVDLWEISLVTFPMLPGARIARSSSQHKPSATDGGFSYPGT